MGDKMDGLHRAAASLRVEVGWSVDLPTGRHGVYRDDERLILLNGRLTEAQALCALAHELAHAIHRDRSTSDHAERRADEIGSTLIVSRCEYAEAEALVGSHAGALARELGVTYRMILAWRRQQLRVPNPRLAKLHRLALCRGV